MLLADRERCTEAALDPSLRPGTLRRCGTKDRCHHALPSSDLTVAVTGPTGEIGQAVVAALERSREVGRILGMARRPFDPAKRLEQGQYRQGDVLDRAAVADLVKDADVVVHLAFIIMGGPKESRR